MKEDEVDVLLASWVVLHAEELEWGFLGMFC